MSVRRVPFVAGAVAVLAGLALALAPAGAVPAVAGAPLLVLAAASAGGAAVVGLLVRSADGPETAPLPDRSRRQGAAVPGDDVDRDLATVATDADATADAVRTRIERAAVPTVARAAGCPPAEARDRLAAGTWTDDQRAARFLADEPRARSGRERLRALVAGESGFQRDAARTIDALGDLTAGEEGSEE